MIGFTATVWLWIFRAIDNKHALLKRIMWNITPPKRMTTSIRKRLYDAQF